MPDTPRHGPMVVCLTKGTQGKLKQLCQRNVCHFQFWCKNSTSLYYVVATSDLHIKRYFIFKPWLFLRCKLSYKPVSHGWSWALARTATLLAANSNEKHRDWIGLNNFTSSGHFRKGWYFEIIHINFFLYQYQFQLRKYQTKIATKAMISFKNHHICMPWWFGEAQGATSLIHKPVHLQVWMSRMLDLWHNIRAPKESNLGL